ncbi:MAG: Probable exported protease [uncultured Nocardioidaceae bacterium]|uniref:Probable exported protease n=1 Tax=uncultured Nocardioidaceae bacterium TaxID=253824 RepID=A0A6J4LIG3_9ACTN|nr:MAG: Probable exported protease [uncultured Nocardioidaceae bacterium]
MLVPSTSALRGRRLLVALLPLLLALGGCALGGEDSRALPSPSLSPSPLESADPSEEPVPDDPGRDPALRRYYEQDLGWNPCREQFECARIDVPLDYDRPSRAKISLSLLKVPASDQSQRVGSLVVNPGGPGASGIEYAARASTTFGTEVQQAFDIVGFDPRGVGESTPVDCVADQRLDAFVAYDPDPDTAAERGQADRLLREFGRGCAQESGQLAAHISTVEAVRDIDIIRELLGDAELSFFGASYGTLLGATYADLFPDRVGRMVLDGAIDPSLSNREKSLVQAESFETALRAYVGACVDRGSCFLGDSVDAGAQRIRAFLDEVEQDPLEVAGGRTLEAGNAVLGIWYPLYDQSSWPILDSALQSAFAGDGSTLLSIADAYVSRGPDGYLDNSLEALYAISCLDTEDTIAMGQAPAVVDEFEEVSPTFGAIFAYGLAGCSDWPFEAERKPAAPDAAGAKPILVIGTSRDPATPLEWAEALSSQLESGVLVRRDGDGHTGYHRGNECVDDVVESYLVSGEVPRSPVDC